MEIKFRLKKQPVKSKVLRRMIKEATPKGVPFNLGVKEFKRLLKQNPHLTRGQRNQAAKLYKQRAYERFYAIKEQYEKMYLLKDKENIAEAIENGLDVPENINPTFKEGLDKQEEV